jgi:MoaA/NifB/PqqE/SkfB family radical SAM enzyme
LANIGYIQVVRHCNHHCGFCSNPTAPGVHTLETVRGLIDGLAERGYYGVILTGGEPALHPDLPRICALARESGLHVRMVTNGTRLSDPAFAREMAEAGLQLVHVSIYSVRPGVEEEIRGVAGTLDVAFAAARNSHEHGIAVNINCVINRLNADHLDENIETFVREHPYIDHFVWNNLDPSMGRAEVNRDEYTPRLADLELPLARATRLLGNAGKTFRVEKVPLCYMTEFAHASTETRKIIKGEERIVHFLDDKGMVRQTEWGCIYAPACDPCSLKSICAGLFDRGNGYDPGELHPVFVDRDAIVQEVIRDPADPSYEFRTLESWKRRFDGRA